MDEGLEYCTPFFYGILDGMFFQAGLDISELYTNFNSTIASIDCGDRCAPYNVAAVPFCCDIHNMVPSVYRDEWLYLKKNTNLWTEWKPSHEKLALDLELQTPEGQVLIECLGHLRCQRNFRTITCRSFPFFPYINRKGEFIGFTYYWEYQNNCWVISHLESVTREYHREFMLTWDAIFKQFPEEREHYRKYSITMRRVFGRRHQAISLFHRSGHWYKETPGNGRLRKVLPEKHRKYEPYLTADRLPFREDEETYNTKLS